MPTEIYAYFYVEGDKAAEWSGTLTKILGLEPDREGPLAGAPRGSGRGVWRRGTARHIGWDFEAELRKVLDPLAGREALLRDFAQARGLDVGVNGVAWIDPEDSTPSIHLSPRLMSQLVAIKAEVDFDLYVSDPESDCEYGESSR